MNNYFAPLELKFADNAPAGVFSGYGAVFGNEDSHGDVIKPGAFAASIAERKASGRPVPMHLMHKFMGGDGVPVGVWTSLQEDSHGLKVEGKISGMNTDAGRLLYERVKDGALGGLSIGYKVRPDGATYGKSKGEPKRTLTGLDLHEISLVDDPSNALSRISEIKSVIADEFKEMMKVADMAKATTAVVSAIALHQETLSGSNSPTVEQRAQTLSHLQDIHEALTGQRNPAGMKSVPTTLREFEGMLRASGYSNAQARAIATFGFKSALPRDEAGEPANQTAAFMQALLND